MMQPGRITISKPLRIQILSEILTIKGSIHEAHVSLRLAGKNCFQNTSKLTTIHQGGEC